MTNPQSLPVSAMPGSQHLYIQPVKNLLDNILEKILITIMAVMVVNVLWQVASRYIVQSPSAFTDELSRYLLIWLSLLGASYVTGKKMHLSIELLATRISPRRQQTLNVIIYSLVGLFALLVMVVGGFRLVYITLTLGQTSAALEIPLAYVYVVLPLGGFVIIFYCIYHILYPGQGEDSSISDTVQ